MTITRRVAFLMLCCCGVAPLAAQNGRALVFQGFAGGVSHLRNLNSTGAVADFKLGYNVGAAIGVQANDYIGLHGDFTYTRNEARGAASFNGAKFDRFFYGAHLELSFPNSSGLAPFVFGGGGGVTVHEAGPAATLSNFTKPAAMFGAGLRYQLADTPLELLLEGKSLVYKWQAGEFSRTQWDLSYSAGVAYRLGF